MKAIERHYGCRGREVLFKGMRTLTLENELVRISLLLDKGTDIVEFLHKPSDTDFLWHAPWASRLPAAHVPTSPRPEGTFLDVYEGGWTEVLPTAIAGSHLGAYFGDMGEASLLPWEYEIVTDRPDCLVVRLEVELARLPLRVEKTLTLERGRPVLRIDEQLVNLSEVPLEVMWGQHPTFGAPFLGPDCVVDVPACQAYTQSYGEYPRLRQGGPQAWPYAQALDGTLLDLSRTAPPESRTEDMLYLGQLEEGWYAFTDTARQVGFGMRWDVNVFPYLWYWQCFCGPNPQPFFGRAYAVGIEPWTTPPIRLEQAIQEGTSLKLGGHQTVQAHFLAVAYRGVSRVSRIGEDGQVESRPDRS
jgi:hypothetical protein